MNTILSAMVNGCVVCVPLVAVVWLVLRLSRRVLNAATRYAVWWLTLGTAAALPLLYLPMPDRGAPVPTPVVHQTRLPVPVAAAPMPLPAQDSHQVQPPHFPVRLSAGAWSTRVLELWLAAAVLMLLRLTVSFALLQKRRRSASDAPASMQQALTNCGVRRRVRLAITRDGGSPMVTGPFRPCILIPEGLLTALDDAEINQVLLHEASHLARYDDCALMLQRLLEAVLVLHPVARWIGRRIDLEREIACDDAVIAATGQANTYASCLIHVAEMAGGFSASHTATAATDERSHLTWRVDMLLNKTRLTGTHLLKARFAAAIVGLFLLACTAARTPALLALTTTQVARPPVVAAPSVVAAPQVALAQTPPVKPKALVVFEAIRFPVTVTDPLGRFVTGLEKDAFQVYEDGVEQRISSFSSPNDSVSIKVIWASGRPLKTTEDQLSDLRRQEASLLLTYSSDHPDVRRIQDQIVRLELRRALDRVAFSAAFERVRPDVDVLLMVDSGSQALLDTLHAEMTQVKSDTGGRRAIVVVFEPAVTSISWPENEINSLVREASMPVYTFGVREPGAPDSPASAILGLLAEATGGSQFSGESTEVFGLVKKIDTELRNQYVVGYVPSMTGGKYRHITVKLISPTGVPPLTGHSITGYYPAPR